MSCDTATGRSRLMSGPPATLRIVDVGTISEEMLNVPGTVAECDALMEHLWAALPSPLLLPIDDDAVQLRPTRAGRFLLAGYEQRLGDVALDVFACVGGLVSVPWARASRLDMNADQRAELTDRLQAAWNMTVPLEVPLLLDLIWQTQLFRGHMFHGRLSAQDTSWQRRALCGWAATREPGPAGHVARHLLDSGWHGTAQQLLAVARHLGST